MRVVIFSSELPARLDHLLSRLAIDLPEVTIAGVLYERPRQPMSRGKRLKRVCTLLRDAEFVRFVGHTIAAHVTQTAGRAADAFLRFLHAAPREPNGPPLTLDRLIATWSGRVPFHVTADLHDAESLAWVRQADADLGLIYATRILKPVLFTIPRRGSVNIHKHRLPDYRGGGAPGLWELRDGCDSQTVTVHRVMEDVDAGAIVGERSFPIRPFDTLESIQLKADVVGVDLIVDVLRDERSGRTISRPQPSGGALHKGWQPHQVHALEREICAARARWHPTYTRTMSKLLVRLFLLPFVAVRNHGRRRARRFPVVVLFHHLTCDSAKHMGIPTMEYARHVRYLKRHYRIVSLDEAVALLQHGNVDAPTVALTFDDGYADNMLGLRAVAELERVPVTVCVCTDHVSRRSELAHDIARNEHGFPSIGWDDVRYLRRHGFTIASHSRTHFDCGSHDVVMLTQEIAGSKRELEAQLGEPVEIFAFPKGRVTNMSPIACELALQQYSVVMSAAGGVNFGPMPFPMHLQRCSHPDSLVELELQLQELLDRPASAAPERSLFEEALDSRREAILVRPLHPGLHRD